MCAGIIGTKVTQIGVLIRLEPNRSSQVSALDRELSVHKKWVGRNHMENEWSHF